MSQTQTTLPTSNSQTTSNQPNLKEMSLKALREYFIERMEASNFWLYRGILAIYDRQTQDEKASEETHWHNMAGFMPQDARILTSFAVQILRRNNNQRETLQIASLSEKQLAWARKLMPKYARQLARIARANMAA